jgi:hypothetical protein
MPRATCTAAEGLDAETFRGFQLAGQLFLLTSFFIEPEGSEFESCLPSQTNLTKELLCLLVNSGAADVREMANTRGKRLSLELGTAGLTRLERCDDAHSRRTSQSLRPGVPFG